MRGEFGAPEGVWVGLGVLVRVWLGVGAEVRGGVDRVEATMGSRRDCDAGHGSELVREDGRLGEQVAYLGEEGLGGRLGVV